MDPTLANGQTFPLTYADLRALDVIGWDLQAVPEPGTLVGLGLGLAGIAWRVRRRAV
jgi:hypothetical protein